ncbi:MAG TPA: hypothetical protein VLU43_06180 [Anaeromyxobacteraceae bacterium]|nr:hypothetical protein [Anaeromyxobacteraceae bacterium]
MRSIRLASLLLAAALPAAAHAKAWQGITPGTSSADDVQSRFGEPTTKTKRAGRVVLAYLGDQALAGTKQAQFYTGEGGVVQEITVFLATQLEKEAIEGTYGKSPEKTFTDSFLPVWIYRAQGVTVYFGKDGYVEAITFGPGTKASAKSEGPPRPAPAPAKGEAKAP